MAAKIRSKIGFTAFFPIRLIHIAETKENKSMLFLLFCLVYGLINKISPGGLTKYVCVMSKSNMAAIDLLKITMFKDLNFVNKISEVDDNIMNTKCV